MASGSGVEDDDRVLHRLDVLHDLGKNPSPRLHRDRKRQVLHHRPIAPPLLSDCSIISWMLEFGSISMAERLSNPLTLVASLPNFCRRHPRGYAQGPLR